MIQQTLHDGWTVRAVPASGDVPGEVGHEPFAAHVPGCVHTDLMRAGKIPDPYEDFNEHKLQWIGLCDWEYRTTFDADARLFDHERIDLVCDGLDTVARIELNGTLVAQTQNMHRGYRFDIRPSLKRGRNELVITFSSPVKYAERMRDQLRPRPYCNGPGGPFNFIRKMACNFGWDWGPALPTCGIWKEVRVEGWSEYRLDYLNAMLLSVDQRRAVLRIVSEFEVESHCGDVKYALVANVSDASGQGVGDAMSTTRLSEAGYSPFRIQQDIAIESPQLWWPTGHGEQPLYFVELAIEKVFGSVAQPLFFEQKFAIGLRTVELDTSSDDIGARFVLKINGKPIYCKGFNWIPDDCFLDRATEPARVRQRIQQAVDAGANMLRVWGGGIYETDQFYRICDELGVMVWQDFPFACAMYPEEEPFWSEVEAEARDNVARLSHHPSLVLWNGCNENIMAYCNWGWKDHEDTKGRTWGKGYYFDLLPRIVKELDPSRPYWAASPWSGDEDVDNGIPPNADTHGNMHCWRPWFHEHFTNYRNFAPRFCSEFGFQGPATYASINRVVPREQQDFGGPAMRHRQKSGDQVRDDGDQRNLRALVRQFNVDGAQELLDALAAPNPQGTVPYCGCQPLHVAKQLPSRANFDDLHYVLQLTQARALTLAVEWFRSRHPRNMGVLYWQLNDCWPGGTTWSCIDGDGRPKPLWYATRRFFAPRLMTIQPTEPETHALGDNLDLFLINDSDEPWHVPRVEIRAVRFESGVITPCSYHVKELTVPPSYSQICRLYGDPMNSPKDPADQCLVAWVGDERALWFFLPDRQLRYPEPRFDAKLDGSRLLITANTLIRDLCINIDRLDPSATISDQLITLLPGESFIFDIQTDRPLTVEQLTARPVLQCANWYGKR